jgi:hypothetical protein
MLFSDASAFLALDYWWANFWRISGLTHSLSAIRFLSVDSSPLLPFSQCLFLALDSVVRTTFPRWLLQSKVRLPLSPAVLRLILYIPHSGSGGGSTLTHKSTVSENEPDVRIAQIHCHAVIWRYESQFLFFKFLVVGLRLRPLGTSATVSPTVPALDDEWVARETEVLG